MKILIVAATPFEIAPFQAFLQQEFKALNTFSFQKEALQIDLLITGVSLPLTAFHLAKKLQTADYQLAINAGIGGAFRKELAIGQVVQITEDCFADIGIEHADGAFESIHKMELIDPNVPPFKNGKLMNEAAASFDFLPKAKGVSVNLVHGTEESIAAFLKHYPEAEVETMEGASFFYACLAEDQPFIAIRAISNYVETRNRDNWDIPTAITNLNQVLLDMTYGFMQ